MELIGLTVEEGIKAIQKKESKRFYQVYVCTLEHKERNYFKLDKRVHLHNENGERVYRVIAYDLLTYAKNEDLQKDSFILDFKTEQTTHDLWSFNGYESTASHNVYYLYIDGIKKGNKATEQVLNKSERLIPYKKGELTKAQRRFTL